MYTVAKVAKGMTNSVIADIRDYGRMSEALSESSAEIVFHLAAQPLVRQGYADPASTLAVNILGTVNLLEAVRHSNSVRAMVNVTTDKCYEDLTDRPCSEDDPLGGVDPYSCSKACSELVTVAYRKSFYSKKGAAVATARAGNVIGGGDWASHRLIPDIFRAIESGESPYLRSPGAIRPWQHALEPLHGYLLLAERLYEAGEEYTGAWNFGPPDEEAMTVGWIADWMDERCRGAGWRTDTGDHPHESRYLGLDSGKAREKLAWRPRWSLDRALDKTIEWREKWLNGDDMLAFTLLQIDDYEKSE